MKRLITILIIALFTSPVWAADTYYIDLDYAGTESGTCAEPYNSLLDVDDPFVLNAGDIVLVKAGSSGTQSETAIFTEDGTDTGSNDITFGTYTWSAGPTCTPDAVGAAITRPIIDQTGGADHLRISGSYYHIYNLHFTDGENDQIRIKATAGAETNVIVEYCTFEGVTSDIAQAVLAGATSDAYDFDYVTVRYCSIDCNDQADETAPESDGIEFGSRSDEGTITGNDIKNCDHFGIRTAGENTTVTENYITDEIGHLDGGIALGTTAATGGDNVGFNYIDLSGGAGLGIQVLGKQNNVLHHNMIISTNYSAEQAAIQFTNYTGTYGVSGNQALNNIIYDGDTDMYGIRVHCNGATCDNITIANNIILGGGLTYAALFVRDDGAYIDISTYEIHNNNVYDFGGDYALIEGDTKTKDQLNAENYADDNKEEDPQLSNPALSEFWPSNTSSNSWQAGYDTGTTYNVYLFNSSDFTTTPPTVDTQEEATHHIGAFTIPEETITGVKIGP